MLLDRRAGAGVGGPPPGFASPWRRAAASALVATIFYGTLLLPLSAPGLESEADLTGVNPARLFLLHAVLLAVLAAWGFLAYVGAGGRRRLPEAGRQVADESGEPSAGPSEELAGGGKPTSAEGTVGSAESPAESIPAEPAAPPIGPIPGVADGLPRSPAGRILAAFRLRARRPVRELALGLLVGAGAWAAVLAAAVAVSALASAWGGEGFLPSGPPPLVLFLAGQPVWLRLGISLSAGAVEEIFFRGFLQPRIGLWLSTGLFVLAHAGYGQPLQLLAVGLLSVIYGTLVRRRGNVWAAVSAHALFDAVQLLVVIPAVLRLVPGGGGAAPLG